MTDVTLLAGRINSSHGLSHAYILAGSTAQERESMAGYLAAAYVCTGAVKPCQLCPGCRKAAGHIHPDIITVAGEEGKDITVAQIRTMRTDAYTRPNEAPRKVYLIWEADRLNTSAQNALLKVLEEGPPYAAFLLATGNDAALLPTIVSRCERLRLAPSGQEEGPSPQLDQEAQRLAGALTGAGERTFLEYVISLEKWKREELAALFDQTAEVLRADMTRARAHQILPLIEQLRAVRQGADFNVGSGHLLGWLAGLRAMNKIESAEERL